MKNRCLPILLASLMSVHLPVSAEDIDLFVSAPPSTAEVPNVLLIMDNTANWNTAFANEKAALVSVFNGLPVNKFRVGLMLFTETGSPNNNIDGGYIRAAIRLMDSTNQPLYSAMVNGLSNSNPNSDKSNGGKAGKTMAEAYFYFTGAAPYTGNSKAKTDYTGNVLAGATYAASRAVWARPGNAISSIAGSPYTSPVVTGCAKNFIIFISNGAAQDNSSDNTTATTQLSSAGGSTTAIPISPSGSQSNVADEWARWMKKSPSGITTYTVDVDKVSSGQGPGWTALLKSMAGVSGGKYFDVSSSAGAGSQISAALNTIFGEIQAVNSVFASVSLPASANTQSTFLNQVFVGMFRPDGDSFPRWPGNLKQYKLGLVSGSLKLLDANDTAAINSGTGFVTECARSYWTPSSGSDMYWSNKPQGSCIGATQAETDANAASNRPDGPVVEKGAQAYGLRSTTTRSVYTCSATFASCTALVAFNNSVATQALLGAASTTERDDIIAWAKGIDNLDEDIDGVTTAEMRQSAHGDVVHSRPVAINFGSVASPQVAVFYSANDGLLRAINGNRSGGLNINGFVPGMELWTFAAPEFFGQFKRIRDNTVSISYAGTTVPGSQPKPYGIDGPITAFQGTVGGSAKTFIYAAMRRGGRALYAFDVTNTLTGAPTLKWKVGCPNLANDTGCTAGFAGTGSPVTNGGIGQTWSPASALLAGGYGAGLSPMLIMGGGYDTCEDTDAGAGGANHSCTAANTGHKIYVLDADTGALLKTFNTDRGVVGGITLVPDTATGLARYGYAADLGGNLYRISGVDANTPFASTVPGSWTITKVASMGCDTTASCTANRKFLFAPDVIEPTPNSFVLLAGSGDREKPLLSYGAANAVSNDFYTVQDKPTVATWLSDESTNCGGVSVICRNSLTPVLTSATPSTSDLSAKKGVRLGLAATEQVVTSAITVSDIVTFSSFLPATPDVGTCGSNLGDANVYNINYKNAAPSTGTDRYHPIVGGGLPPSPVAGKVTLDNGVTVPFLIGGSPDSPLEGGSPSAGINWIQPKSRVYWHIEQ